MTTTNTKQTEVFEKIGPLPIYGRSWPLAIALLAWAVLIIIGARLLFLLNTQAENIALVLMLSIGVAYLGMLVMAYYMLVGRTTIHENGIHQQWIVKRDIAWQDVKFAKFVPLFFSKRLICFTQRGFPIVFQGASRDLEIAFAHISLIYKSPS